MREQVEKLVIELVEYGILKPQEAGDVLTVLMETIPVELVKNSKDFINNLKEEFKVNADRIFTENGVDVNLVKSVTEKNVKVEKEKVEKTKIEEIKREETNNRRLEEELVGFKENEEDKLGQVTDKDEFNYDIPQDVEDELKNLFKLSGFNIELTEIHEQNFMYLLKTGATKEEAQAVVEMQAIAEEIEAIQESIKPEELAGKDSEEVIIERLGVDKADEERKTAAKAAIAESHAFKATKEFAKLVKEYSRVGNGYVPLGELDYEEFLNKYFEENPCSPLVMDLVRKQFTKNITESIREIVANDGYETKTSVYSSKALEKYTDKRTARMARLNHGKDFYNNFGYIFKCFFRDGDINVMNDYRKEMNIYQNEIIHTQDFLRGAKTQRITDYKYYLAKLKVIDEAKNIIYTDRKEMEKTVARGNGAKFTIEELEAKKQRELLANDIVKQYFWENRNSPKSLVEYYMELGSVAEKTGLTFNDLVDKAMEYTGNLEKAKENTNKSSLRSYEFSIEKDYREYRSYEYVIETITGKSAGEIDLMTEEEIKALKDTIKSSEEKNILDEMRNKRRSIKEKIESDKEKLSNHINSFLSKEKMEELLSTSKENSEFPSYVGEIDDIYANMTIDSRSVFLNEIIDDRNGITMLSKKGGISIDEAAKKYFEDNPDRLNNYSKEFLDIYNGENSSQKFGADMVNQVILYQNSQLRKQIKGQEEKIEKEFYSIEETGAPLDVVINLTQRKNELKNRMRVSNALDNLVKDDDGTYKESRNDTIESILHDYLYSGIPIVELVKNYEVKSSVTKDIDINELIMKLAKRFEKSNPGSGKKIIEHERKVLDLSNRIEACKTARNYAYSRGIMDVYDEYSDLLQQYEDENRKLSSSGVRERRKLNETVNNSSERDDESQIELSLEDKKEFSVLNVQKFIAVKRVSEKAIVEQHSEIKNAIELSEQQNTRDVNDLNQKSTQEQDERS